VRTFQSIVVAINARARAAAAASVHRFSSSSSASHSQSTPVVCLSSVTSQSTPVVCLSSVTDHRLHRTMAGMLKACQGMASERGGGRKSGKESAAAAGLRSGFSLYHVHIVFKQTVQDLFNLNMFASLHFLEYDQQRICNFASAVDAAARKNEHAKFRVPRCSVL
jgi:hypothetical protein